MTDISIVKTAYWEQIYLGETTKAALRLATVVYLRRNPHMPFSEALARVSRALGGDPQTTTAGRCAAISMRSMMCGASG